MLTNVVDFKPIRNKIRGYSFESLTRILLDNLKAKERIRTPSAFWYELLLLRWALEFAGSHWPSKVASELDVEKLIAMLLQLEMSHETFRVKTNGRLSKTFTILASQQMGYQEDIGIETFARQIELFSRIKGSYDIEASFTRKTGLSIRQMLDGLFVLWSYVLNDQVAESTYNGFLSEQHVALIREKIGADGVNSFVNLLMVTKENVTQVLAEDRRLVRDYNLQIFEPSFFTRRPFLLLGKYLIIPHRKILNCTINHFIYEFMKNSDPEFPNEFGKKRMEPYLELGLKTNSIPFLSENELSRKLATGSNVVDFLAEESILIECKAIELRPYVSVNPTDELLATELKKNIVKAYAHQMISVARQLQTDLEVYGIIVTYKKLHLGDTDEIWSHFLEEASLQAVGQGDIEFLPPRNLFLFDLASWDKAMEIIYTRKISLRSLLFEIQGSAQRNVKFGAYMHLDEYNVINYTLPYLRTF